MSITEHLAKLEAIAGKATPGPWQFGHYDFATTRVYDKDSHCVVDVASSAGEIAPNAAFIALARTELPKLCAALKEAHMTLVRNAKPALGGKQQQQDAQVAIERIAAILGAQQETKP